MAQNFASFSRNDLPEIRLADSIDYETLDATLDLVASWLLAAYGPRLAGISLSLEGHYGPVSECYGVVPLVVTRGVQSDGTPETRDTLPTLEISTRAETLFMRLCPEVAFHT